MSAKVSVEVEDSEFEFVRLSDPSVQPDPADFPTKNITTSIRASKRVIRSSIGSSVGSKSVRQFNKISSSLQILNDELSPSFDDREDEEKEEEEEPLMDMLKPLSSDTDERARRPPLLTVYKTPPKSVVIDIATFRVIAEYRMSILQFIYRNNWSELGIEGRNNLCL